MGQQVNIMDKFKQRVIKILGKQQKDTAHAMIDNVPEGVGLEVVLREEVKTRSLSQNNLYWANLEEISQQLWWLGKQYSAEGWHHAFKCMFMPDEKSEPYLFELVKNPDSYHKYEYTPNGERICKASTTDLTKKGFTEYIEQIYAFATGEGVMFKTYDYE